MTTTTIPTQAPRIGTVTEAAPRAEVAAPKDYTIKIVADCGNCRGDLSCTVAQDGQALTWYHVATGTERCDGTRLRTPRHVAD